MTGWSGYLSVCPHDVCVMWVCMHMRMHMHTQYLVLGWATAARDLELIIKLVGQLCASAQCEGGATIVVLTERSKLDMEELFRWAEEGRGASRVDSRLPVCEAQPRAACRLRCTLNPQACHPCPGALREPPGLPPGQPAAALRLVKRGSQ